MSELAKLIEAALFSAAHPLSVDDLRSLEAGVKADAVREALEELGRHYDEAGHAFELQQLADGYQLLTRPEYAEALTRARIASRPRKLSTAALETLAIIAYRQPVSRAEIEEIRGVAADGVLKSLQERDLIDVAGRGEGLGRPLLYGTTRGFLDMLGITEISELPRLDQLSVALQPIAEVLPGIPGLEDEGGTPMEDTDDTASGRADVAEVGEGSGSGGSEPGGDA